MAEVRDVTRRYTKEYSQILRRRVLCPEAWLSTYVHQLTEQRLIPTRRHSVVHRWSIEAAALAQGTAQQEYHVERSTHAVDAQQMR
jgi:hypothetical protein